MQHLPSQVIYGIFDLNKTQKMKPFCKILMLVVALNTGFVANAQNEFSKWYFGFNAGLDFSTSPPTVLTNGALMTIEGVATISDSGGNLLFYTDGSTVYNSTHTVMVNGSGLYGNFTSSQSAIIVKQPGNTNIYYIFNVGDYGFTYSIVDMTLAAGLGSVSVKNTTLYTPTCEKQAAVRHCNGKDAWIITHHNGTNEFRTYLLNNIGVVSNPVVSAIGESSSPIVYLSDIGQLKISPDGRKLAVTTASNSPIVNQVAGGFFLFDFDAATGVVSNSLSLLSAPSLTQSSGAYGIEFSQDGTKLYGVTSPVAPNYSCSLHQWDVCANGSTAIVASHYLFPQTFPNAGSLQRAINGKIYLASGGSNSQSLSVINNPNASGAAMNFIMNGQSVTPGYCKLGLPNYINNWTAPPLQAFTNTVSCQTVSFSIPTPTLSGNCMASPFPPNAYLWDFGDPGSGAANTSSLSAPVHSYSLLGTYSVSLILYSNCGTDTLTKVITISNAGPSLNLTGNFTICAGNGQTYTVSGGSSYLWSNNTTAAASMYAPASTGVFSVTATLNGCSTSQLFTITVMPCTGISNEAASGRLKLYPNPVKEAFWIDAAYEGHIMLIDLKGNTLLKHVIKSGSNRISTSELEPGIYEIRGVTGNEIWHSRILKIED